MYDIIKIAIFDFINQIFPVLFFEIFWSRAACAPETLIWMEYDEKMALKKLLSDFALNSFFNASLGLNFVSF